MEYAIWLFGGFFTSYLVGLVGASSATIYIPLLLLMLPTYASGIDNFWITVLAANMAGLFTNGLIVSYLSLKAEQVNLETIKYQLKPTIIGGVIGFILMVALSKMIQMLKAGFGILFLYDAWRILKHYEPDDDHEAISSREQSSLIFLMLSTFATTFGIGTQPYIMYLSKKLYYTTRMSIGTARLLSLISGTLTLLSLIVYHAYNVYHNQPSIFYWPVVICFMLSSPLGIMAGFQMSNKMPVMHLKKYYAIFVALAGIYFIGSYISGFFK